MPNELPPCPFCGSMKLVGPHFREYVGDYRLPTWWCECGDCPCGMSVKSETVDALVAAWSRRSDREDAEKWREFQRSLVAGFREDMSRPLNVWDSRNVAQ